MLICLGKTVAWLIIFSELVRWGLVTIQKSLLCLMLVAHTCYPSYLGG
jgi:hypothetical protein